MKLTTLNAKWLVPKDDGVTQVDAPFAPHDMVGVIIDCPMKLCDHRIRIFDPKAAEHLEPLTRWNIVGFTYNTITCHGINGGPSSIHRPDGCRCHFWIRAGKVLMAAA